MRKFIAALAVSITLVTGTAAPAAALTVYPATGYYSWNGTWYCYHDYTFWDRLWSLNAALHDGYYKCPYSRWYRA